MKTLDRKLIRDLFRLRGQVIATAAVMACGIVTFVTMQSTYKSLLISRETYYESYRFAQIFAQMKRAPESLRPQIAAIAGVSQLQTRIVSEVSLDVPGLNEPATGRLVSIPDRRATMLNDLYIRQGRYIEPERDDEVVVSEAFTEANRLTVGDSIGAIINGRWKRLRIVGIALSPEYIYEVRGAGTIFPDNKRFGVIWMGRKALGAAFNMEGAFNDVAMTLSSGSNEAEVILNLDRLLEPYGGLGAYGREDQISHRFISDEIAQNRAHGLFIPPIFLGVAIFLLHTVLSRLVGMQRDQIAVLKAFGYGNFEIGLHYLKFALFAVTGGAILGTISGLWFGLKMTEIYAQFYRFPVLRYEAGPGLVGLAALLTIASAAVGSIGAVLRTTALPPAEAMRPEAPPRFKPLFIEKLGLQKILSPVSRMIARNLERRPVKALLSSLGIAFAVAILLIGQYFFDAINYLIEVQFRNLQREDMTVLFNEPKGSRARYELTRLPGVLRCETFRAVPVKLVHEHRSRRLSLLGLEPDGDLRRLLDSDLRPVDLPQDGISLTSKLAEILDVKPGEFVTVEVLEGERPVRRVAVVRLVDELIGISAYMDIRAVNRLMREGGTISGAFLSVDPALQERLYGILKRMPAVSGASVKMAALESFQETIAKSIAISTIVLIVSASVIAFGMVYNGARIALSERGRELASLRILGFSQFEVAVMLLGEQAILTLIAIPMGLAIGLAVCKLIITALETELFRLPLVISSYSYGFTILVVAVSAFLSGLLARRRLAQLDLVEALKTKE